MARIKRVYITGTDPEQVLPEPELDFGGSPYIPPGVGVDPSVEALETLARELQITPDILSNDIAANGPHTDNTAQLYDDATMQRPLPLTEAIVKPPAPPVPLAPVVPPSVNDPVAQLQELLGPPPQEEKPSVTNQDQGLTGQLDEPVPQIPEPRGLLTGATLPMPASPQIELPPPQVPISQSNFDPSSVPPEALIPRPTPQPQPSFIERLASEAKKQTQQLGSGILSTATSMPMDLGVMVAALAELGTQAGVFPEGPRQLAETLMGESARMKQGADFATGATAEPQTPGQNLARTVGKHASPNALFSGAMTTADLLSQAITPSPAYAAPMDKKTAEHILFGPKGANQPTGGPRVSHTIPTLGGPAKVSEGDLKLLGYMGAVTIGAMFAPSVISRVQSTVLPHFNLNAPRDVKNAAPGTEAISNRIDLARTYDDVNAGLFRVGRRAGIDPVALYDIQSTFNIQTGGASRNLINSAVTNGRMETPTFTFQTRISVADLAKRDSEPFRDYLHARDTFDDITRQEAILANKGKNAVAQQAAIGPIAVRGMTKQDALSVINALERTNPEVKDLALAFRENVRAVRQFQNAGQYGTLSKTEYNKLNKENPNYVPWKDSEGASRALDEPVDRLSPFDALKDDMQKVMRQRMENEAKGMFIDEMRAVMPNSFVRISPEEASKNPIWERNTVEMYRRGKLERYTTDPYLADVLNHDPYAVTGIIPSGFLATKRLMESSATGVLAPWFAATSAIRSYKIGKQTTPDGMRSPTIMGTMTAIPRQLGPQLADAASESIRTGAIGKVAKAVHSSLSNGSGGWLDNVLGPQTMQAVSTKLADVYERSLYAQLERAGTHQGSFLQHSRDFNSAIDKAIGASSGTAKSFLHSYKQFLNAVHNSPSFDFASRNVGNMPLPKLAAEARHLTGDPLRTGQFSVDGKSMRSAIRVDKPLFGSELAGKAATKAVQAYGLSTAVGREVVPWWNITTQGAKRIGQAYIENPQKFVGKVWLYTAMPAAANFLYARGLGLDPNGQSYSDYQMRGRSEYNKLMNTYIAIPGRPAEDGIEIPRVHELAIAALGVEVVLDHVARSDVYQGGEDFLRAAASLIGAKDAFPKQGGAIFQPGEDMRSVANVVGESVIQPPTPPLINAVYATQGQVLPQGMLGGEAYKKKQDPYDQLGGMNATVELMARAFGTGLADVIGSSYAAYTQTPEGVFDGISNAMKEGSRRAIMKTPIVRNAFDILPPRSGNTDITEQLFKKEKVISNLSRYYRTWTRDQGNINTKLASERGGFNVENLLGSGPPKESSGLDQPPPTNPLYIAFMEEVYNKFNKDSPDKKVDPNTGSKSGKKDAVWVPDDEGGIGIKSAWRRYGDYSAQLKRLRQINEGNNVTWQLQLSQRPDQLKYLKDNNIDHKDVRTVRNFYERKRQEVATQILFSIRAVEEDFSRRLGSKFKIEDLDPYAKGPQAGQELAPVPTIPPWSDGQNNN